ncbi:hypothetical protein MJH54_29415, partial [Salmonella enterica subsp. enterica serovar Montevideo]|nr:hypothetical protein [Salmonella enterica subsp. enterica serovar Montevideo]
QVAQKTGVSNTLENEFKGRAAELQKMETDLQSKMQRLQSMKADNSQMAEAVHGVRNVVPDDIFITVGIAGGFTETLPVPLSETEI